MKYNYFNITKQQVRNWITENMDYIREHVEDMTDYDALEEYLTDTLWAEDSVTGNASGSFTFNTNLAKAYVKENLELALEAYQEFDSQNRLLSDMYADHWEAIDVTIRCYVLGCAIEDVLKDIKAEEEEGARVIIMQDGARIIEKAEEVNGIPCFGYYYKGRYIFGSEEKWSKEDLQQLYNNGYFEEA